MPSSIPTLDRPVGWTADRAPSADEDDEDYKQMCRERLTHWDQQGMFAEASILERLTELAKDSHSDHDDAPFEAQLEEDHFAALLRTRFRWLETHAAGVEAVLFRLFRRAAVVPLLAQSSPSALDRSAYTRARAILSHLGERTGPMSGAAAMNDIILMRRRTVADDCRLLFQCMAAPVEDEQAQDEAGHPTSGTGQPTSSLRSDDMGDFDSIDVSTEDPYVTDLADVLTTVQPDGAPLAKVARCFFVDIAARFPHPKWRLEDLRVSGSDLRLLLKFLASFQQLEEKEDDERSMQSQNLDEDVRRLDGHNVDTKVDWPGFHQVFLRQDAALLHSFSNSMSMIR